MAAHGLENWTKRGDFDLQAVPYFMARITIGCIHIFLNQRVVYIVLYIYVLYRSMRYIVLCIYTYITVSLYRHLYLLSTEILILSAIERRLT